MATNGDKQTGTYDDGVNLLAGENSTITVDLNAVELDQTEDIAPPVAAAACTGGSQSVAKTEDGEFSKVSTVSVAGDNAPVDDIQKKIQRAERFGVPVQLSEEEKRNSRNERFGAANTSKESETSKKDEELKRKARAERFGIPESSAPTDDDARKKARLARFGGGVKVDSVEEEKRKARAERFSKPASSSSSVSNDTSNINQEAPIEGNVD